MRDIRTDWHYREDRPRSEPWDNRPADNRPREDRPPSCGARLVVRCDAPGCGHAALIDPRPIFGPRSAWPVAGRSERFRCRCGSRETMIAYTINTAQREGPMSPDAIRLWT